MIGRRRRWRLLAVLAITCAVLGVPRAAWAHNALIGTDPEDQTTVSRPPRAVVLTFNEPAITTGTKVLVSGPSGEATSGVPRLVDNTVEQPLSPNLPAGDYTVQWRVTSADGHPVNGTFTFRVRSGASPQESVVPPPTVSSSRHEATAPADAGPSPTDAGPSPTDAGPSPTDAGPSPWWWLLALVPVGLAAVLGWRFSRR
jgi:methionine-rich copper-binding protein CopC